VDESVILWLSPTVTGGTATIGVAQPVYKVAVPESHPHDAAHDQPMIAQESFFMGGLGLVVLDYGCLGYVRRFRR
jgi:hypothetical protein